VVIKTREAQNIRRKMVGEERERERERDALVMWCRPNQTWGEEKRKI
jgi:hypothetical protein